MPIEHGALLNSTVGEALKDAEDAVAVTKGTADAPAPAATTARSTPVGSQRPTIANTPTGVANG